MKRLICRVVVLGSIACAVSCNMGSGSTGSGESTVATPYFNPVAGTYAEEQQVTIHTATSGASIYYTTDGTTPTTDSSLYASAIAVSGDGTSMTIKAIAVKSGMTTSSVRAGVFTIDADYVSTQIIADHAIVDRYDDIPATYLAAVKEMWVEVSGESHSGGYRIGLQALEDANSTYAVSIQDGGSPEAATTSNLRASRIFTYGEASWYTSSSAISTFKTNVLDTYNTTGNPQLSAIGFGWCWDMTWDGSGGARLGGSQDPDYHVRWGGTSVGGPEGDLIWGLDSADTALTGNSVCMDTYLDATQQYSDYCATKGYPTKVFFTTGPVDTHDGEGAYQRELKHEYIRNYVKEDSSRILFDYADILSWDDDGNENLQTWTSDGVDYSYHMIADDNMLDLDGGYSENGDHIGDRGALRLGKAMWWMLARMAGWDGVSTE